MAAVRVDATQLAIPPSPNLLESFPIPPTYIPPSGVTLTNSPPPLSASPPYAINTNPPLSLPPSSPLPPVPGPSPISEVETLLFLSTSRLRRVSKLSITSVTSSRRDSTATIASITSVGSNGVPSLSPSLSGSSTTSHSTTSSSRPRAGSGASAHSLRPHSSNGSRSAPPLSFARSQSSDKSPRLSPTMEISIVEEDDVDGSAANLSTMTFDSPYPYSDVEDDISPQILPATSIHQSVYSPHTRDPSRTESVSPSQHEGRTSPDIQSIISTTPRPRRRTSSILSAGSSSRSKSRPPSEVLGSQRASATSVTVNVSRTLKKSDSELSCGQRPALSLDEDGSEFDELERELEGNGSESDSSLDLHTPFAHVMLRDGLISPRSKVISQLAPGLSRPGSVLSTSTSLFASLHTLVSNRSSDSVRTKSGVYKDERDTVKRRHRHRDGKLLKGGIGLTTGLGWSDSEDEDSPSPLTRRLSSMASSRKSSVSSLRSSFSSTRQSLSPRLSADPLEPLPPTPKRLASANYSTKTPLSISSASNPRLPPTPEIREDRSTPPPLPPKDFLAGSIPPKVPTKSPKTLNTGPRPLKLTQSSTMLRSSSLTTRTNGEKTAVASMSLRLRTYSQPSPPSQQPSISKFSNSVPGVTGTSGRRDRNTSYTNSAPTSPPAVTATIDTSNARRRSRIGTGMMYKRSASDSSPGVRPSLLAPSAAGSLRRLRMPPSPLQAVTAMSSPTSPGFGMEIGVAI